MFGSTRRLRRRAELSQGGALQSREVAWNMHWLHRCPLCELTNVFCRGPATNACFASRRLAPSTASTAAGAVCRTASLPSSLEAGLLHKWHQRASSLCQGSTGLACSSGAGSQRSSRRYRQPGGGGTLQAVPLGLLHSIAEHSRSTLRSPAARLLSARPLPVAPSVALAWAPAARLAHSSRRSHRDGSSLRRAADTKPPLKRFLLPALPV